MGLQEEASATMLELAAAEQDVELRDTTGYQGEDPRSAFSAQPGSSIAIQTNEC